LATKQGEERKKIEEYEIGKINFENVLQSDLHQANNCYRNGNFAKFCLAVQTIWSNAMRADKEAILNLVKERENERHDNTQARGYQRQSIDTNRFLRFVETNPKRHTNRLAERKIPIWREIFMLINEGLKRRYYGGKKEYEKDTLET